jgi:hypothetical protein
VEILAKTRREESLGSMMLKGEGDALAHEPQCPIRPEDLTHIYAKLKSSSSKSIVRSKEMERTEAEMRTPPEGREMNSNGLKRAKREKQLRVLLFFSGGPLHESCTTRTAQTQTHKNLEDEAGSLCVSTCSQALAVRGGPQLPCSGAHPCHCHPQRQAQGSFYLDLFRFDLNQIFV